MFSNKTHFSSRFTFPLNHHLKVVHPADENLGLGLGGSVLINITYPYLTTVSSFLVF